jgi:predicted secreted Zn-dependent protease
MRPADGLRLAVERSSYPVAGSTAGDLRAVIEALGPTRHGRTFAAFTDWEVSWDYSIAPGPGGMRVAAVRVGVRAAVVVPRWRPPRSAPPGLTAAWQRFLAAIEDHEQGHVNLAVEVGRTLLGRLEGFAAFADPAALKSAVEAAALAEVAAARERERLYDDASDHGATQGVSLPDDAGDRLRMRG